jgi:hypothetical protein
MHTVHFRQFKHNSEDKNIYGNVSFNIKPIPKSMFKTEPNGEAKVIESNEYIVYPNPANSEISIKYLGTLNNKVSVSIYDATGKIILSKNQFNIVPLQINEFNVSSLANGNYFISITNNEGIIHKFKFTKK